MSKPKVFISEEQLANRVQELGELITSDFEGEDLVVVCVLKGSFMFCSDLVKKIHLPIRVEFVQVSSYADGKTSSGECKMLLDVTGPLEGKNVLIVEDIVDSGLTISFLQRKLLSSNPASVKLVSLLFKPEKLVHDVVIDYLGFEVEDKFVVGYGLDYAERFRELPYIGILEN